MKNILLTVFLSLFLSASLFAQNEQNDEDLIQFSGVVVSSDSLSPVSFANIIIKNSNRGTTSDFYGYFSLVAQKGDVIVFSSIGYKTSQYNIPDTLVGKYYSLIHTMRTDTVKLKTVQVFPWPTPRQFKDAFLSLNIPDDDLEIARKNLDPELLQERAAEMPMTGSMNFKWQMQQHQNQLYYAGQYRPNNLLNPIAWAKFIQAWKRGDFKGKD